MLVRIPIPILVLILILILILILTLTLTLTLTLISLSRMFNSESDYDQHPPGITYPRADPIITRKVK